MKQERAAKNRAEILSKQSSKRKMTIREHVNAIKRREATRQAYAAFKAVITDKRLFAALNRHAKALELRRRKAKRHNEKALEKAVMAGLNVETQKEQLARQIETKQKEAAKVRGAHLLSVVQHHFILGEHQIKPPVAFEIPLDQNSAPCPEVAKRLQESLPHEITMDQITHKLTKAAILRMRK